MIFEDMLAYGCVPPVNESFSSATLRTTDEDTARFYRAMATDIALAAGNRSLEAVCIVHLLRIALTAVPTDRTACWAQLYGQVRRLLHTRSSGEQTLDYSGKVGVAVARLQHFLEENLDISHALAIDDLEAGLRAHALR